MNDKINIQYCDTLAHPRGFLGQVKGYNVYLLSGGLLVTRSVLNCCKLWFYVKHDWQKMVERELIKRQKVLA